MNVHCNDELSQSFIVAMHLATDTFLSIFAIFAFFQLFFWTSMFFELCSIYLSYFACLHLWLFKLLLGTSFSCELYAHYSTN